MSGSRHASFFSFFFFFFRRMGLTPLQSAYTRPHWQGVIKIDHFNFISTENWGIFCLFLIYSVLLQQLTSIFLAELALKEISKIITTYFFIYSFLNMHITLLSTFLSSEVAVISECFLFLFFFFLTNLKIFKWLAIRNISLFIAFFSWTYIFFQSSQKG